MLFSRYLAYSKKHLRKTGEVESILSAEPLGPHCTTFRKKNVVRGTVISFVFWFF